MNKSTANKKIMRIVDVNANRLREGLRVCEDIARFALNDPMATRRFKSIRHRVSIALKGFGIDKKLLILFRDADGDIGKKTAAGEKSRCDIADIFKANIKRGEESMRVLEEFAKLSGFAFADKFKMMRFELYSLEKALIEKL